LTGSIRFAMPGSACTVGVLRGVAHLLAENPGLELQIRIVNRQMDVIGGGYDVALSIGQPKDSRLVARKLYVSSGWVLAVAPSYLANRKPPRTPTDLKRHNCLRFAWGSAVQEWPLVDRKGNVSVVEVHGNFEADDSRVLRDAMYAGLGIGLRPDGEVAEAVASGDLVRILPGYRSGAVDVFAIMPKAASRVPRVARFLDAFAEVLSREA
jgi:DNA-binding transcriptional LysR family regulator